MRNKRTLHQKSFPVSRTEVGAAGTCGQMRAACACSWLTNACTPSSPGSPDGPVPCRPQQKSLTYEPLRPAHRADTRQTLGLKTGCVRVRDGALCWIGDVHIFQSRQCGSKLLPMHTWSLTVPALLTLSTSHKIHGSKRGATPVGGWQAGGRETWRRARRGGGRDARPRPPRAASAPAAPPAPRRPSAPASAPAPPLHIK